MGFWNKSLDNSLMSSGFGNNEGFPNETFDLPSDVDLDDNNIPEYLTDSDSFSEWRSNTGDLFQETHSSYDGVYQLDYLNIPGAQDLAANLAPAPGSEDLAFARNANGIPGTNRSIFSQGPVTGTPDVAWTDKRTRTQAEHVGLNGPVVGGADVAQGVANAYYAQQNAMFSQAAAEASLMAAI